MVRGDDLREYVDGLERVGRTAPRGPRRRAATATFGFLHQ
jgi:hypothetical protein